MGVFSATSDAARFAVFAALMGRASALFDFLTHWAKPLNFGAETINQKTGICDGLLQAPEIVCESIRLHDCVLSYKRITELQEPQSVRMATNFGLSGFG